MKEKAIDMISLDIFMQHARGQLVLLELGLFGSKIVKES